MARNCAKKRLATRLEGGSSPIVLTVLLCVGLLWPSGCRQEASTVPGTAAVQPGSEKAAEATTTPDESEGAQAGENVPPAPGPEACVPKIQFETVMQELGEVGTETTQTTHFTFKNVGKATLKIVEIRPCCGSVVRGVRAGDEFAPGKGGTLEVEYHVGSFPGALRRSVMVTTNDPDQRQVNLGFTANVVMRIACTPERLNLFMNQENAGCGSITLKSLDGRPFSITDFRSTADSITAEFDPAVKATQFVLEPKANIELLDRNRKGQVSINLTHPECGNVRILYDVLPEFTISPPQIMLFNIRPNEPVQREIWLISNYRDDFEIESVSSQRGTMKLVDSKMVPRAANEQGAVGPNELAAARCQLRVEVMPPPVEDKRSILSDILQVKIQDGETLSIPLRGFYAGN